MTDKELLELAAKAAGQNGVYQHWEDSRGRVSSGIAPDGAPGRMWWNPLTDDGDALRLAVKLGLSVWRDDDLVWCDGKNNYINGKDPCEVMRRAIVRAAAELGKAL